VQRLPLVRGKRSLTRPISLNHAVFGERHHSSPMLPLIQLHLNGQDDELGYSHSIRGALLADGGREASRGTDPRREWLLLPLVVTRPACLGEMRVTDP
jgi:hypothetical protein